MPLITAAQLARVAPHAAAHIVAAIVDHADDVLPRYGLATAARLPDFLAHVLVESAYLTRLSEDLDYTAARLVQVWPSRFKTVTAAAPYAHQPEKLADLVYGGRMGNTGPDDGWLNRGQGLLEETGHDNLQALALHMRVGLEAARAALTSDAGMLEAAAAVYVMLGAPAYADRGDIVGTTRCVNGGTNGLADRRAALALCRKVWPRVPLVAAPVRPAPAAAPTIPPQVKETAPVKKSLPFFVALMGLFGITSAHAATFDMAPIAVDAVTYIVFPVLGVVTPVLAAILVMPLRRFVDQKTALDMTARVNDVLDKAISFGAAKAEASLGQADFKVQVDGFIQSAAVKYAMDHAPQLMAQAGGVLAEKVQARLAGHQDVLALKAMATSAGAPLQLVGAAA